MTNMTDIISTVDHAASKDDRWLMVAIIVLAIVAMVMFWRWVIGDREKVAARLNQITDAHITASAKLAEVVANNTSALHEVREVMSWCRKRPDV